MRSNGGLVHVSDRSSSPVPKGELVRENNRDGARLYEKQWRARPCER